MPADVTCARLVVCVSISVAFLGFALRYFVPLGFALRYFVPLGFALCYFVPSMSENKVFNDLIFTNRQFYWMLVYSKRRLLMAAVLENRQFYWIFSRGAL